MVDFNSKNLKVIFECILKNLEILEFVKHSNGHWRGSIYVTKNIHYQLFVYFNPRVGEFDNIIVFRVPINNNFILSVFMSV